MPARILMSAQPDLLIVEDLGEGRYRVSGGSQPHILELDLRSGALLCDCPGFKFRGRCRHAPADPASDAAFANDAGPGLERDVPPPDTP